MADPYGPPSPGSGQGGEDGGDGIGAWLAAIPGAVSSIFGGGGQAQPAASYGSLFALSPQQQALQHMMQRRAMMGNVGDTGFASALKQGKSSLQNLMARQGISADSGVGMGAMSNMIAQASAADAQNRHGRMMDLANLSPAFAQASDKTGRHNMWQTDPTGAFNLRPFKGQPAGYMFDRLG
jgi:hypothetical protein